MYRLFHKLSERKRRQPFSALKKILIVRPDRLGDVLLTFPAVYNISKAFPRAEIYYLCRRYTEPIVRCYTPVKDTVLFPESTDKKAFGVLTHTMAELHFDLAIHLLPKASLAQATYRAGIPYRLGTGYRLYSIFYNLRQFEHRKYNDYHEAEYNLRMLRLLGIDTTYDRESYGPFNFPSVAQETVEQLIKRVFGQSRYIMIHPGSGGSSVDWSLENFISLIRLLTTWNKLPVAVTGIESEREHLAPLLASGLPFKDMIGQLDLIQLALFIKKAALFSSNSTGPLHLAVAMGTPVLGFYPAAFDLGPKRWGPFMRSSEQVITPNDCIPAEAHPDQNLDMTKITPQKAFDRIRTLIKNNK